MALCMLWLVFKTVYELEGDWESTDVTQKGFADSYCWYVVMQFLCARPFPDMCMMS